MPLRLEKGDRICFIGNLLLDAERRYGHLETLIHQHHPNHDLTFRNLAWPADEIDLMPRPDNFGDLEQHLTYFKADVIIAAYGYNESFAGPSGFESFKDRLDKFLTRLKSKAYNGETAPKIVLVSPQRDIPVLSKFPLSENSLTLYTHGISQLAVKHEVGFANVHNRPRTDGLHQDPSEIFTIDGHANKLPGHHVFASAVFEEIFEEKPPNLREELRQLVVDKATQFFYRYRPLNTFYYTGGRNKSYGYLDFLPAMRNFDLMVENRDKAIHDTLKSGNVIQPDDSNLPKLDEVLLARGANEFLSPADELTAFKVDPRFEVNCFASEEDFPEMACPISMRWDNLGRLWVSTSVTYPHVYPGQKPCDKIIILEDTDQDGKADKCTTWADDLHLPLSFVLDGSGGVYCSEQPHLTHLTDQDGDGKMDHREIVLTGFGCEDSHHSLHDFIWTPGGDLMFRESIFHHSQIETPYGPIRTKNSSWFLYKPRIKKLIAFGSYPNTNPWGVTFDKWGNHVASHPIFASTFHSTNPAYPTEVIKPGSGFQQEPGQHPKISKEIQAYSGTCGHAFVDHDFWPKEMQGGFIKARYKPTNKIEFHTWTEKEDHFAEEFQFDLIFSTNLSFIPVDLNFGPRGACYVCDWYNPVKGHAQYSLRDPRRDRKAGRIWRIIPKGATLLASPKIAEASIDELLKHLKSPHFQTRSLAKLELKNREREIVRKKIVEWREELSEPLHLLEAAWLEQTLGLRISAKHLEQLTKSDNHLVAAAALGIVRFADLPPAWNSKLLHNGAQHPSQHVRREAAICASYLFSSQSNPNPHAIDILPTDREEAVRTILKIFDQPVGSHLSYATRTALHSSALKPYWPEGTAEKLANPGPKKVAPVQNLTKEQRQFDQQKNLATIKIGAIPERLLFTKEKFTVKSGQPIKLVFNNPDVTEHNLLILAKDTPIEEIGALANEMAKDPDAAKKHYIPDDKRILQFTRLLKKDESETLRFDAPSEPGDYPYLCTFPGHWIIMKGVMTVK